MTMIPETTDALYPYELTNAQNFTFATPRVPAYLTKKCHILHDARIAYAGIHSQAPSITYESLQVICEVMQRMPFKAPLHLSRKNPFIEKVAFDHKFSHSLFVLPGKKAHKVFISLHEAKAASQGAQGIKLKKYLLLKFSKDGRLLRDVHKMKLLVALKSEFEPNAHDFIYKTRRISCMQTLSDSVYFPKNYAFVRYPGKRNSSIRIFQEQADCDLLVFHNTYCKLDEISIGAKLFLCKELVQALLDLSSHGLIHRDFKIENILVFIDHLPTGESGIHVKLTDLGFTSRTDDNEALQDVVGSLTWCAPEILEQIKVKSPHKNFSQAIDSWALGLLIHLIATGHVAPIQLCLSHIRRLKKQLPYCDAVVSYIESPQNSIDQLQKALTCLEHLGKYKKGEPVPEFTLELKNQLITLKNSYIKTICDKEACIPFLINALPPPPQTYTSLKDIACGLLQKKPEDRLPLNEALSLIHRFEQTITE